MFYTIVFESYNPYEMWDPKDFGGMEILPLWPLGPEFEDSMTLSQNGDLFLAKIMNLEAAREGLRMWFPILLKREKHRGADDGTYDYYPDAWRVTRQFALALNVEWEYNEAVKELMANSEYGDPDGDLFDLIEKI
jgi:hypothetical protein